MKKGGKDFEYNEWMRKRAMRNLPEPLRDIVLNLQERVDSLEIQVVELKNENIELKKHKCKHFPG